MTHNEIRLLHGGYHVGTYIKIVALSRRLSYEGGSQG